MGESQSLLIQNISLVDVENRLVRKGINVLVEGERISKIMDDLPDGNYLNAERIDGNGLYAIPGLIDTHVHLKGRRYKAPSKEAPISKVLDEKIENERIIQKLHSYIYSGVTSIFDAGNVSDLTFSLRNDERASRIISPRIFCTGNLVTSTGGHGYEVGCEIDSVEKDVEKLESFLGNKPDLVKITYDEHGWGIRPMISILPEHVLRDIIAFCHSHGYRVTVHVSNEFRSRQAIEAGADVLAHTVIQSPITDEFAEMVVKRGIPLVSTLQIGDGYSRLVNDPDYLNRGLYKDCVDDDERQFLINSERDRLSDNIWTKWMEMMTPVLLDNIRRLHTAGAIISSGTDGTSGPDLQRELQLLNQAGLSPMETIRAATINGAIVLGRDGEIGSIAAGKFADIVLLNSDPTMNADNLSDICMVIKNGKVVDRSKLNLPVND